MVKSREKKSEYNKWQYDQTIKGKKGVLVKTLTSPVAYDTYGLILLHKPGT